MKLQMSVLAPLAVLLPLRVGATFRTVCAPFALGYMDPIVTPGSAASHLHHVVGTVGFSDRIVPSWMAGNKTTCDIDLDHSNYWAPAVYRTDLPGGSQLLTPVFQPYYEFEEADQQFLDPEVLGKPMPMLLGRASGALPSDNFDIEFHIRTPDRSVPEEGLQSGRFGWHAAADDVAEILVVYRFPSCWNGESYDADQSHVAYPDADSNRCPSSHPKQFPRMRLEQRYVLDTLAHWRNFEAPFEFSSGGETTAHADVVLLWDVNTLGELIAQCTDKHICDAGHRTPDTKDREAIAGTYTVPREYRPTGREGGQAAGSGPAPGPTLMPVMNGPAPMPTLMPVMNGPAPMPTLMPVMDGPSDMPTMPTDKADKKKMKQMKKREKKRRRNERKQSQMDETPTSAPTPAPAFI